MTILFSLLMAVSAFSADPVKIVCQTDMTQFKKSASWHVIGDSNQRLEFEMKTDEHGRMIGTSTVRFMNDQSEDNTNSLHGLKASIQYSEGDGLVILASVLKYENKSDTSPSRAVTTFAMETPYEKSLEESVDYINLGYLSPKVPGLPIDDFDWTTAGFVDYELIVVRVMFCRLE